MRKGVTDSKSREKFCQSVGIQHAPSLALLHVFNSNIYNFVSDLQDYNASFIIIFFKVKSYSAISFVALGLTHKVLNLCLLRSITFVFLENNVLWKCTRGNKHSKAKYAEESLSILFSLLEISNGPKYIKRLRIPIVTEPINLGELCVFTNLLDHKNLIARRLKTEGLDPIK